MEPRIDESAGAPPRAPARRPGPLRRRIALAGSGASAGAGLIALLGWVLGLPALARLHPDFIPMAPSTALLLLAYGTVVGLCAAAPASVWIQRQRLLVGLAGSAAATTLFVLSSQRVYLGVERFWMTLPAGSGGFPLGHMSPATAALLAAAGLALLALPGPPGAQAASGRWSLSLAGALCAASGVLLLAYLLGAPVLYSGPHIPPAATTAGALLALGAAQVALSWPQSRGGAPAERAGSRGLGTLLLGFAALSAGVILAGFFTYRHFERRYRTQVERQLSAVAELKSVELEKWRAERLGDAALLTRNPALSALVRRVLDHPGDAAAEEPLRQWLGRYRHFEQYRGIVLLDPRGRARLSVLFDREWSVDPHLVEDATAIPGSRVASLLDIHRHRDGSLHLGLVAPLFHDGQNRVPLGAIVMDIDPAAFLYPFLKLWPGPSDTAETLLVRREGNDALFLNELRFRKDAALTLRLPLDRTETPAVAAVLGRRGIMEGIDYRGVPVIADVRPVPGSPWFLVTRMDRREVYEALRGRLWLTVATIAALLLGAGAGLVLLWRQRTLELFRGRLDAERERAWLRTVIARSLNEIYVFDAATLRFTFVNEGASRNLGYPVEELLGMTPLQLKPRFDAESFAELVRPLREGAVPVLTFETLHRRKDGSEYPVEVHLQLVESGRGPVFLAVVNDITERTRAEARLRLDEARLEGLLELSEHQDLGERQLLDYALQKALALTGSAFGYVYRYREESRRFELNSWSRGVMEECTVLEPQTVYELEKTGLWGEAVRQRQPILVNDFAAANPLKRGYPQGHVHLRNFLTVPIFSGFEIVAVVGVANKDGDYDASDMQQLTLLMESVWRIVERTRAETELNARNAELERFIYTVSHDLKSPLVTVKTFLGFLERDLARADAGRIDGDLQHMRTAVDKMGGLLEDLLEMSRVGRVVAEPVSVSFAELAAEAVKLVAGGIAARGVVVEIDPAEVALRGDRARLVEIWQNLVENAVKFMGDQPAPRIRIGAERRGGEVVFFVRDNGIGVDPRYREKIFGLFERLDPAIEGTGLGLAMVRRIVELYGGTIRAESEGPGRGAAFLFTLPGALEKTGAGGGAS